MPDPKKIVKRPDTPLAPTPEPKYSFKEFAENRAKNDSTAAADKYLRYKPKEIREAKSEGNRAGNQVRTDMRQTDMIVDKSKDKYGQDKYTRRK